MKKLLLLPAFALVLGFASCKKDYKCTCTTTGSSTADVTTLVDVNKKTAKANCVSKTGVDGNGGAWTETCTLSK